MVLEKFSRIDLLVLNAGINAHFRFESLKETSVFDTLMKTNFYSNVNITRYALPYMKKSRGKILVVSSLSGKFGLPQRTAYCASKFALTGFFESLRTQESDVKIVMVYPTSLNTPMRNHAILGAHEGAEKDGKQFDAHRCAQLIVEGVESNKEDIYIPFKGHLGVYLQPFFPRLLREKLKREARL